MIVARKLMFCAVIGLVASVAAAGTVLVTTSADSGPGSLRQAILDANSGACTLPCSIQYGSTGFLTVAPLTLLPDITATAAHIEPTLPYQSWQLEISGGNLTAGSGVHIRGAQCSIAGVIINGFPGSGIVIEGAGGVRVDSNVIGLDRTGTHAVPNGANGVTILNSIGVELSSNTIGGNAGNGVYVLDSSQISFGLNTIGKQYLPQGSGDLALGNGATGVFLQNVHGAQLLGDVIANNGIDGIATLNSTGIRIEGEPGLPVLVYGNPLMPIDIGFDGITDQGRPVLTVADISNGFMRVVGSVQTMPNTPLIIDIFASDTINAFGIADAKNFLYTANVTSDASGVASFEFRFSLTSDQRPPVDVTGQWISATATIPNGTPGAEEASTSELSTPLKANTNNQNYTVTNTDDSGSGSLRQAILDANAGICSADFPCRIEFNFSLVDPPPPFFTIQPLTPLPAVTRAGIVIDGKTEPLGLRPELPIVEINGSRSTPGPGLTISAPNGAISGVSIRRLAINGFNGPGILIDATQNSILNAVLHGNFIGTDPTGTRAVPNSGDGVRVRGDVPFVHFGTYGSGNRFEGNLISGNGGDGVRLEGGFFEFEANLIGTDFTGKLPVSNGGSGVKIDVAAGGHLEGNTIAFNGGNGLTIAAKTPEDFRSTADATHSNGGPAIVVDPQVQPAPEITSATYDPATQTATIKGSVRRAPGLGSSWTTSVGIFSSRFPEAGERGVAEVPLTTALNSDRPSVDPLEFTVTVSADLRGMRVSATATPFIYQGFKGPPAGEIFGQGFEYGTTSTMSKAVPVVTAGCPADIPQILGSSSNELRWSTVAGATAYNVWLRKVPGVPEMIGTTSGGTFTVTAAPGTYEWFVEALFPQCPSMKSDAERVTLTASGRRRVIAH